MATPPSWHAGHQLHGHDPDGRGRLKPVTEELRLETGRKVSHGFQLKSLWRIPTAAVS